MIEEIHNSLAKKFFLDNSFRGFGVSKIRIYYTIHNVKKIFWNVTITTALCIGNSGTSMYWVHHNIILLFRINFVEHKFSHYVGNNMPINVVVF